jgi:hypothetical protein
MTITIQLIGLLALLSWVSSVQWKSKSGILRLQIVASVFYCLHYGLLDATSAAAVSVVSIARLLTIYLIERKAARCLFPFLSSSSDYWCSLAFLPSKAPSVLYPSSLPFFTRTVLGRTTPTYSASFSSVVVGCGFTSTTSGFLHFDHRQHPGNRIKHRIFLPLRILKEKSLKKDSPLSNTKNNRP